MPSTTPTPTMTSATFLRAIELTQVPALVHDEAYEAVTQYVPWPKAYGGDMVAQSAAAMMRSVDGDRSLHSMHSYFMRPVDVGSPGAFPSRAVPGRRPRDLHLGVRLPR